MCFFLHSRLTVKFISNYHSQSEFIDSVRLEIIMSLPRTQLRASLFLERCKMSAASLSC